MGPLRGGKGGPKYEGHMRVPTVAWWPGRIPAGSVTHEIAATIDILPTFARLAGGRVPGDRVIDGRNIESLRRVKDDASEVRAGTECGLRILGFDDLKVGDQIVCYKTLEVKRTLD